MKEFFVGIVARMYTIRAAFQAARELYRKSMMWHRAGANVSVMLMVIPFSDDDDEMLLDKCFEDIGAVKDSWTERRIERVKQRAALAGTTAEEGYDG